MLNQGEASEYDLVTECMRCITNAEVGPEEQRSDTQPPVGQMALQVPS